MQEFKHKPVLLDECLSGLNIRPDGVYVDGTLGGLHAFTGYKGAILTDSGGFQLYSMIRENPDYGEIREKEILFRPDRGDEKMHFTPE